MGRLVVAVEGDDLHALLAAVVPGAAVAELLPGGAPPRQQVVLAVPHVVALAAAARGRAGRGGPAGEARGRPAGDGGGPDLVEAAGKAGPAAEGRPAVEGWPVLECSFVKLGAFLVKFESDFGKV